MKNVILLIGMFYLLSFPNIGSSQTKEENSETKRVIIDLETRDFTSNSEHGKLSPGDDYTIEVIGINTYCYRVKFETGAQLDTVKYSFPSFSSFALDAISGLTGNFTSLGLEAGILPSITNPISIVPFDVSDNVFDTSPNGSINTLEGHASYILPQEKGRYPTKRKSRRDKLEELMNLEISKLNGYEAQRNSYHETINDWLSQAENFTYTSTSPIFPLGDFLTKPRPTEPQISSTIGSVKTSKSNYLKESSSYLDVIKNNPIIKLRHEEIINAYDKDLIKALKILQGFVAKDHVSKVLGNVVKKRIFYERAHLVALDGKLMAIPDLIQDEVFRIDTLERDALANDTLTFSGYNYEIAKRNLHRVFVDTRNNYETLEREINTSLRAYLIETNRILQRMNPDKELVTSYDEIQTAYKAIVDAVVKQKGNASSANHKKLYRRLIYVFNNTSFKVKSFPRQFNGDKGWLKVTFTPKDSMCEFINPLDFPFPKYKPPKLATTTSFYISNLRDMAYSLKDSIIIDMNGMIADTVFVTKKEDAGEFEIGTAITMNYSLIKEDDFNLNVSVGPAISFTNPVKMRLVTGFDLAFGKRNRFAIGFGAITGYVDRLSNLVSVNEPLLSKPERVVVSKLKAGFYANIGYQYRF